MAKAKLLRLKTQRPSRENVHAENFGPHEVLRGGSSDGVSWAEDHQLTAAVATAGDEGMGHLPSTPVFAL